MIKIEHVRISLRKHQGNQASAGRIATSTMEHLEQLAAQDLRFQDTSRILDRVECAPVLVPSTVSGEDTIAKLAAEQAWRAIRGWI
jgi:hypothetical protein